MVGEPTDKHEAEEGQLLTAQKRELLEKRGLEILEDKPQLLYCFGSSLPSSVSREMTGGGKAIMFVEKDIMGAEERKLPILNEAIDSVILRKGLIQSALEEFGEIKTDRSIMNENVVGKTRDLALKLSHSNGYGFCDAFPPKKDLGYVKIQTFVPQNLSDPFMMRKGLEQCSAAWLEPQRRSRGYYDKAGLDQKNLAILEDIEILKKAIESEGEDSALYGLQKTIDDDFGGDLMAFQKRWKEFYQNWWPDEFKAMQDSIDKTKEFLRAQKD